MTPYTQERFESLLTLLDEVPRSVGALMDQERSIWRSDSPAGVEIGIDRLADTSFALAFQSITGAGDHLFALRRAVTSPAMTSAPWTLARASIEMSCAARWLLDPDIDVHQRIARGLNVRLQSIRDSIAYVESVGSSGDDFNLNGRIAHLESLALSRMIRILKPKSGTRILGFGEMTRSATEIASMFGLGPSYRLFSGMAHGRSWATQALGFAETSEPPGPMPEGLVARTQTITPESVFVLVSTAIESWIAGAYLLCRYAGWPTAEMEDRIDRALDAAALNDRFRPWRKSTPWSP